MNSLKLLTAGALAVIASSASAADLGNYPVKARQPAVVAASSWNGFYLGVNAGYAWGGVNGGAPSIYDTLSSPAVLFTTLSSYNFDINGGAVGGQAGYNVQFGQWVLGLETDIQWSSLQGGGSSATRIPGVTIDLNSKVEWFGTVRGRLGYAFDRVMVYGTGGLAYGSLETTLGLTEAGVLYNDTDRAAHLGWTAGAGLEAALGAGWSAKVEYLHVDLGSKPFSFQYPAIRVDIDKDYAFDLVRVGVNYRFGSF
jgi:outer membrane immunogenic protein